MSKSKYKTKYHPVFYETLDHLEEQMTEQEFDEFYDQLMHEINKVLAPDPFNNSRECKYGILKELGFRTITFHSKPLKIGTGDMRLIFKVDESNQLNLYFAVGKRFNTRPRPDEDIYSIAEKWLKENKNQ
ncbi:MAG TPA: hypothetical protein VNR38_00380 [Ureibacillus sp.]|nr:hypothetical protein [Ureibacillus sp.]